LQTITNGSTPQATLPEKKVIDVVDLDDEDDVVPQSTSNPVTFNANQQFRLVPTNQLQQQSLPQGLTYTVVPAGSAMNPGINRVMIARPQQSPGQLIVSRNGIVNGQGAAGRLAQVSYINSIFLYFTFFKICKITFSYSHLRWMGHSLIRRIGTCVLLCSLIFCYVTTFKFLDVMSIYSVCNFV
jgi:hypothetical protein